MKKLFYISLILLSSCSSSQKWVSVEPRELYDQEADFTYENIEGFKMLTIFDETMGKEVWVSPEKHCVTASLTDADKLSGEKSLHVKWDKISGGCTWIGIGFGWGNWQPKDISALVDIATIEIYIKSVKGDFKNLPVAFAIEDYTGIQSYYGFEPKLVTRDFSDQYWNKVAIPLKKFPFEENGADLSKIKQMIIQLEGDGDVYIDKIQIVRNEDS